MGKKHAKKRFFCVKYHPKPDKKFDELVTLSKKKIGPGKMKEYTVILDLVNEDIIKNDLPGIPVAEKENIPYSRILDHYKQWYNEAINTFLNS